MARAQAKHDDKAQSAGQEPLRALEPINVLVKAVVTELLIYLPWVVGPVKGKRTKKPSKEQASLPHEELEERLKATVTEAITRELHARTPEATNLRMGLIARLATFELEADKFRLTMASTASKAASTKKAGKDKMPHVKPLKSSSDTKA